MGSAALGGENCSISMKLLRFALLTFDPTPETWREWAMVAGEAQIRTQWAQELETGGLRIFVTAGIDLSERPTLNDEGLVIVPEGPLRELEILIETSANLIAVGERCKRFISSPIPSIAFLPEDQMAREWLDSTNGILHTGTGIVGMSGLSIDSDTLTKMCSDRPDGAALLAEALAHDHPTGMFHELLRVFERAFRLTSSGLVTPLAGFLAGTDMGYTAAEVERWLTVLRHPATHADRRAEFVLESDIRPVIPRMMQAAYDVLFNKVIWRNPSIERRQLWRPPTGTTSNSFDIYLTRGEPLQMDAEIFDEVGSYTVSLNAVLPKMPPEIWAKWPSQKESDDDE
jgi:hypothetical protein